MNKNLICNIKNFFLDAKEKKYLVEVCTGCGKEIRNRNCGCSVGTVWVWNPNIVTDIPIEYVKLMKVMYKENLSSVEKYGSFNSTHEGYAVIKEEIEELQAEFDLIKEKFESKFWDGGIKKDDMDKIFNEAIQVNTMMTKFILTWFKDRLENEKV
jgi:hypothetical protein